MLTAKVRLEPTPGYINQANSACSSPETCRAILLKWYTMPRQMIYIVYITPENGKQLPLSQVDFDGLLSYWGLLQRNAQTFRGTCRARA